MSKFNKAQAPYYDYGESELNKQYYQLLAVPGRVAQAREISTMQTIMQGIVRSIGDAIMSNGDVIEGCQVITSADKKKVTVTSGRIYIDGIVMNLEETTVPIRGEGSESIGVKVNEKLITQDADNSLRDPAQGFDNYSQSGCDRIQRTLEVVVSDPEAATIALLYDGDLAVENIRPNYDVIEHTLARRTYDESGSYIVDGLKVHLESIAGDDSQYNVVVESGKAYVLGYELKLPTARRLKNPRAITTAPVSASNYVFQSGVLKYLLDSNPYVQAITNLKGRVQTTQQQVITTNTDSVLLDMVDVVNLVSVKQGSTEYTIGSSPSEGDCYLLRDGTRFYVKWNGASTPTPGQQYTVTYTYNKTFEQDVDYELEVVEEGSYLNFKSEGDKPLVGTNFTVTYNQYLARRDLVYLDQYGKFEIIKGNPDEDGFEVAPVAPVNTLAIAQIYNPPNGSSNATIESLRVIVSNIGLTRFTMNDIQNIVNRVKKTEYNQVFLALNDDARQMSTVNAKKGILTDPIVDFSRTDPYYNKKEDGSKIDEEKPMFNVSMDFNSGYSYLPLDIYTYSLSESTLESAKHYERLVTLAPTGENVVLRQMNATKSFLVNPYSVYPQLPEVGVTPALDSWIDENIVEVPVSINDSRVVSTTTQNVYVGSINTGHYVPGNSSLTSTTTRTTGTSTSDRQVGSESNTSVTEAVVSEQSITYMRQIELTIEGKYFAEGVDNICCEFDGKLVELTPVAPTVSGTLPGSLKADDNGYVKGKFTIPNKVRTGVREVRLYSTIKIDGYNNDAYTIFQSSGIQRNIQRTITTVNTVLLQRTISNNYQIVNYWVDPVAETFVVDKTTVLKGIDLYFESKPTNNVPITVDIKNVVDGNIGSTIYASKTLAASEVSVSTDGTRATRFNFDDPVVLEANTSYAFTVRSVSDRYRIWVAELGGTDVVSGDLLLKNPYLTGVMMSSSNNASWTVHQTTDLKFRLVEDIYAKSGSITYAPIDTDEITRLELRVDQVELDGTSAKWYYSLDGGTHFYSVAPGALRELKDVATSVIFKVVMTNNTEDNITPLIAADSMLVIGSAYQKEGDYVGVNVVGVDEYSNVTLLLYALTPAGTSLTPYFSHDDGKTLVELVNDSSQTKPLDSGWRELVYTASIPSGVKSTQCRLFIRAKSNTTIYTPEFSAIRMIMD